MNRGRDSTKALVHLLTGQKVQETAWWPEYVAHLKRRNAIVHKGLEITREQAEASIRVSHELRRWLLNLRGAELNDIGSTELGTDAP